MSARRTLLRGYPFDRTIPVPPPRIRHSFNDDIVFASATRISRGVSSPAVEAGVLLEALGVVNGAFWVDTVHRGLAGTIHTPVLACVKPLLEAYTERVRTERPRDTTVARDLDLAGRSFTTTHLVL
jgi:hypothetical protein